MVGKRAKRIYFSSLADLAIPTAFCPVASSHSGRDRQTRQDAWEKCLISRSRVGEIEPMKASFRICRCVCLNFEANWAEYRLLSYAPIEEVSTGLTSGRERKPPEWKRATRRLGAVMAAHASLSGLWHRPLAGVESVNLFRGICLKWCMADMWPEVTEGRVEMFALAHVVAVGVMFLYGEEAKTGRKLCWQPWLPSQWLWWVGVIVVMVASVPVKVVLHRVILAFVPKVIVAIVVGLVRISYSGRGRYDTCSACAVRHAYGGFDDWVVCGFCGCRDVWSCFSLCVVDLDLLLDVLIAMFFLFMRDGVSDFLSVAFTLGCLTTNAESVRAAKWTNGAKQEKRYRWTGVFWYC
ncbi:unnamed protein product [Protopolystoma xenopodis]|uniref:Uncharacterized protein n=1 Tax=Protopolystoma xenopodis TaxID=117903 RepID=A0A448WAA3_9PLAT|nr:unnamed protein product [Protopolystoma xenopodis]